MVRRAREGDADEQHNDGDNAELPELASADPAERTPTGEVGVPKAVPDNVADVGHAGEVRVGDRLLLRGDEVEHERAERRLDPVERKIKDVEGRDGEADGGEADLCTHGASVVKASSGVPCHQTCPAHIALAARVPVALSACKDVDEPGSELVRKAEDQRRDCDEDGRVDDPAASPVLA